MIIAYGKETKVSEENYQFSTRELANCYTPGFAEWDSRLGSKRCDDLKPDL